jgi:hypothetical protein
MITKTLKKFLAWKDDAQTKKRCSFYISHVSDAQLALHLREFERTQLKHVNIGTLVVTNLTILMQVLDGLCTRFPELREIVIQREENRFNDIHQTHIVRSLHRTSSIPIVSPLTKIVVNGCYTRRFLPCFAASEKRELILRCSCHTSQCQLLPVALQRT